MSEEIKKLDVIEKMLFKIFRNQQRQRRWAIAKFFLLCTFIGSLTFLFLSHISSKTPLFRLNRVSQLLQKYRIATKKNAMFDNEIVKKPHIALIDIRGTISSANSNDGQHINSDTIIYSLNHAFKNPNTVAVVLRINSPGGDAVESSYVYTEILHQRNQYPKIPVIAICESMCASAAYYIASACNDIFANPSSIVGSLGVIANSIGFPETLQKIGAERRSFTAGKNKNLLDPFLPLKEEHVEIMREVLSNAHAQFIDAVKVGRGSRLQLEENQEEIFSGRIWTGRQAIKLGLIDGFHNLHSLSRERLKIKDIVDYTVRPNFLQSLLNTISASVVQQVKMQLLQPNIQL